MKGVLALVAVRLKSTRLPRKALCDLAGQPLILRLDERLRLAQTPERIVWCTSTAVTDDPLAALAAQRGIACFRGDELDVMSRFIAVAREHAGHTVIRITGDNPLTDPVALDFMVEEHLREKAEYTYISENGMPRGTRCEIISVPALERCHALAEDPLASEYMTLMLRRPDRFNILQVTPPEAAVHRRDLRLTVDTPEDLTVMQAIFSAFNGNPPKLSEIIHWLDRNAHVVAMNSVQTPADLPETVNVRLRGD